MHFKNSKKKIRTTIIEIINDKSLTRLEKRKSIVTVIVSKEVDCLTILVIGRMNKKDKE